LVISDAIGILFATSSSKWTARASGYTEKFKAMLTNNKQQKIHQIYHAFLSQPVFALTPKDISMFS
jgi:hypothetical protein